MTTSRKVFKQIADLWKQFGDDPVVPHSVLHKRIFDSLPKMKTDREAVLAIGGVDIALAAFAKSGPNYKLFMDILEERSEPDSYFRYVANRGGKKVYVLREALSYDERKAITAGLRRNGDSLTAAPAEAAASMRLRAKLNAEQRAAEAVKEANAQD